jgi:hypothetical protein
VHIKFGTKTTKLFHKISPCKGVQKNEHLSQMFNISHKAGDYRCQETL